MLFRTVARILCAQGPRRSDTLKRSDFAVRRKFCDHQFMPKIYPLGAALSVRFTIPKMGLVLVWNRDEARPKRRISGHLPPRQSLKAMPFLTISGNFETDEVIGVYSGGQQRRGCMTD